MITTPGRRRVRLQRDDQRQSDDRAVDHTNDTWRDPKVSLRRSAEPGPPAASSVSVRRPARPADSARSGGSKDDAVACGDVDEVEVDPGPRDLAGKVGKHAGVVLDVDDNDLPLT